MADERPRIAQFTLVRTFGFCDSWMALIFCSPRIAFALALAVFLGTLVGVRFAMGTEGAPRLSTPALIEHGVRAREIDRERANVYLAYALGRPQELPEAYRSAVPWDGTLPLLELQQSLAKMRAGPERQTVARIIGSLVTPGTCGPSRAALPDSTQSNHFYVQYGTIGAGLSISTYLASLETSWGKEVNSFGWASPPQLPSDPPGSKYHVRIDALSQGLYGFVTIFGTHAGLVGDNPATAWDEIDAHASCMVLRNDFSGFPSSPQASLDATTAHEFNHSIQLGYGALHGSNRPDDVFIEGGAAWMEDEVFDSANDNYNSLWPAFADSMGDYATSPVYGYWVTFRGLTERYGTGIPGGGEQILQDFWEETSKNASDNLTALQTALANRGTNLADAFHAYAIAVKFNKPCVSGYAHPYCLKEGPGYVAHLGVGPTPAHGAIASVGGSFSASIEDNYALNWVQLPASIGTYPVRLTNSSMGGELRASVVCDTGFALRVTPLPSIVGPGASAVLPALDSSGCVSVVAIVTNQAQTEANPVSSEPRTYLLTTAAAPAAPALAGPSLSRRFQSSRRIRMSWGVTGGVRYDVRFRSAPYGGDFGGFVVWQTATSNTSGVFTGSPGRTYCFSARSTGAALNSSEYGTERCTAIPVNNSAIKHRGAWSKKKGSGHFLGTFSVSSTRGATLTLAGVKAKRLAILVTKCPGCGTVQVYFGKKLISTVRLSASSIKKKQVVSLTTFNSVRTGRLKAVIVSAGQSVSVEGVGISRV